MQNKSNISCLTQSGQYISNVSLATISSIKPLSQDIYLLSSIKNILKLLYEFYFARQEKKEENTLKNVFSFMKHLEISPYLIN